MRPAPDVAHGLELSPDERRRFQQLLTSSGFQFTAAIGRSWCEGRAASAARQTLSVLSAEKQQELLREWVDLGGGTSSFVASEADAFLEFIAARLPDPSHARTVCLLEKAAYRASENESTFEPPHPAVLGTPDAMLIFGAHAAVVPFFVDPDDLFAALRDPHSHPPREEPTCHLLFAPGIPGLFRRASHEEVDLLARLARPVHIRVLRGVKQSRKLIASLVAVGAIDVTSPE
jgi:hypothetical protein